MFGNIFIFALALSVIFIPLVRKFSFSIGKVAQPRKDRWHSEPTPTLGGIAIFCAFMGAMILYIVVKHDLSLFEKHWSLIVGVVSMFILGLIDDFKPLAPPIKLSVQMLAAITVVYFGGYTIAFFPWPIANIILTLFWLVGITNAINLLDNMDGLAGGVSLITAIVLGYIFWNSSENLLIVIVICLGAAVLGFLLFNFPPAKIFMGDSGSLFLGFSLAVLAIARRAQASNILAVIGVPTILFLLPIIDTGLVTITRLLGGQSPAQGGTDHTSHRLVAFGMSEKQAVLLLYCVALISGIVAAGIESFDYDLSLVVVPLLVIVISLFAAYLARLKIMSTHESIPGAVTRFIVNVTYKRRIFEILFDLMVIATSYYLAYWTRYGLDMTIASMRLYLDSWPFALLAAYISFIVFKVYRGVWKYIGVSDLVRFGGAVLLSTIMAYVGIKLIYPLQAYTPDIFLLYGIFLYLGLTGSRSSFHLLDNIFKRRRKAGTSTNVLIFGADDVGEIILRWIIQNPDLGWSPVGFVDENSTLWGKYIHGVEVLGSSASLVNICKEKRISGVIVASKHVLNSEVGVSLMQICRDQKLWIRLLRFEFESVE